jgi:hypothetical protein
MLRGFIEVTVWDRDGKVVQKGRQEMRSFLNNFLKILEALFRAGQVSMTSTTVTDTSGSSKTAFAEWYACSTCVFGGGTPMGCKASSGDGSYGIVVGSGTTAVALDQYTLISPISHGTGQGQLSYGSMTVEDLGLDQTVSPPVYRIRLIRTFVNFTSSAINMNEVGIMARNFWRDSAYVGNDVKFLITRDVLTTTYTVPAGGGASVAITIEVEVG